MGEETAQSKERERLIRSLVNVLAVQTATHKQENMINYIKDVLDKELNLSYTQDKLDNIIVIQTEEQAPFICCHMDTVHDVHKPGEVSIYQANDNLFAFHKVKMKSTGIGGDDKSGVWATIELLKSNKNINAVFFSNEEKGFIGSSGIDLTTFKNANWILELDRRGNSDFITGTMSSDEFQEKCAPIYEKYDYTCLKTQTTATDVATLISRGLQVSCVNISAGYYNPHSDSEYINITDSLNALNLVQDLITTIGDEKFEFIKKVAPVTYQTNAQLAGRSGVSYANVNSNRYDDDDYYKQKYNTYSTQSKSSSTAIEWLVGYCADRENPFVYKESILGVLALSKQEFIKMNTSCMNVYKEDLLTVVSKLDNKIIADILSTHIKSYI